MKIKKVWIDNPNMLKREIGKMIKQYIKKEECFNQLRDKEQSAIAYGYWKGIDEVFKMLMEED